MQSDKHLHAVQELPSSIGEAATESIEHLGGGRSLFQPLCHVHQLARRRRTVTTRWCALSVAAFPATISTR